MSMLEFEAYHPVVEVLVSRFEVDVAGLENLHEQLLAYRRDLKKLKELLLKYKLTNELVYQQALAEYYDLEFQENIDEAPAAKEFTSMIPIRYAKRLCFSRYDGKKEFLKLPWMILPNPRLWMIWDGVVNVMCRLWLPPLKPFWI